MAKAVLITGASSGFGDLAVKKFQSEGWNVIATMRSPEKDTGLSALDNVLVVRLDVTDEASIAAAVKEAVDKFGGIDALVNNAGYGGNGVFEQFGREDIQAMFDTNVFGLMAVSRAVLPHMRAKKAGVIVNVTSMAGMIGVPNSTIYSATKFAVEGLSEAMALEYRPLNIKVRTVAPGAFGTGFRDAVVHVSDNGDEELKAYATKLDERLRAAIDGMASAGGNTPDPNDVALMIYDCVMGELPIHNVVGKDAEMIIGLKNSMPQQEFLDQMAGMVKLDQA